MERLSNLSGRLIQRERSISDILVSYEEQEERLLESATFAEPVVYLRLHLIRKLIRRIRNDKNNQDIENGEDVLKRAWSI